MAFPGTPAAHSLLAKIFINSYLLQNIHLFTIALLCSKSADLNTLLSHLRRYLEVQFLSFSFAHPSVNIGTLLGSVTYSITSSNLALQDAYSNMSSELTV